MVQASSSARRMSFVNRASRSEVKLAKAAHCANRVLLDSVSLEFDGVGSSQQRGLYVAGRKVGRGKPFKSARKIRLQGQRPLDKANGFARLPLRQHCGTQSRQRFWVVRHESQNPPIIRGCRIGAVLF